MRPKAISSLEFGEEELLLSPNKSSRPYPVGSKAPAWHKQSENMDNNNLPHDSEELLVLSPKQDSRVKVGKGAGLWTKLSGPGAGVNDKIQTNKVADDEDELVLSPKHAKAYPERGKFSRTEKKEFEVSESLNNQEELILSPEIARKRPQGGKFRDEKLLSDKIGNYEDKEELILSPHRVKVSDSGAAMWTKGPDMSVNIAKYDDSYEELHLSPRSPSGKARQGQFARSDRNPSTTRELKHDEDEELKLSPKQLQLPSGGKFGQHEVLDTKNAIGRDYEEELKLEPAKAPRKGSAGDYQFGKASENVNDVKYNKEDEELKLSPHDISSFPKKSSIAYHEHVEIGNKIFEEEKLKLSPKPQPKNLGGRMAPPKPKNEPDVTAPSSKDAQSVKSTASAAASVSKKKTASLPTSSITSKKQGLSSTGATTRNPPNHTVTDKARGKNTKKPINNLQTRINQEKPGDSLPSQRKVGDKITNAPKKEAPKIANSRLQTQNKLNNQTVNKISKKHETRKGPSPSLETQISPPAINAPSPHALAPFVSANGGGAKRYNNIGFSQDAKELSELTGQLHI